MDFSMILATLWFEFFSFLFWQEKVGCLLPASAIDVSFDRWTFCGSLSFPFDLDPSGAVLSWDVCLPASVCQALRRRSGWMWAGSGGQGQERLLHTHQALCGGLQAEWGTAQAQVWGKKGRFYNILCWITATNLLKCSKCFCTFPWQAIANHYAFLYLQGSIA